MPWVGGVGHRKLDVDKLQSMFASKDSSKNLLAQTIKTNVVVFEFEKRVENVTAVETTAVTF